MKKTYIRRNPFLFRERKVQNSGIKQLILCSDCVKIPRYEVQIKKKIIKRKIINKSINQMNLDILLE